MNAPAASKARRERHTPHLPPPTELERAARGLRVKHFEVPVHGLDPAHDGVRVAHLTDLHVGMLTPRARIRAAIERVNQAQPDITVLTGDFVCYHPRYVPVLEEVVAGIEGPVVAVLGNHDYWTDGNGVAKALTRNGYAVLRNQHTSISLRGRPMDLVGIDDAITRQHDVEQSFRGLRSGAHAPSRLVLTHAPGLVRHAAERGGGLVLAGHTHGGQVHVPRVSQTLWAAMGKPFLKGFYRVGDATLYVNCGVGASSVPLRAGAPSEVALLTLRMAAGGSQRAA